MYIFLDKEIVENFFANLIRIKWNNFCYCTISLKNSLPPNRD